MMAKYKQHILMEVKLVLWTEMCFHLQSWPWECKLLGCNGMLPLSSLEIDDSNCKTPFQASEKIICT